MSVRNVGLSSSSLEAEMERFSTAASRCNPKNNFVRLRSMDSGGEKL